MAILSIDLAYKRYVDIGAVVLSQEQNFVDCELLDLPLDGAPSCAALAAWLEGICTQRNIRIVLLDGPQGWKARNNGLLHCRRCERELNTPAKTGEPFSVKPANYIPFVTFSTAVYEAMTSFGWERLSRVDAEPQGRRLLIESFPLSAWRSLEIAYLPAKAKKPNLVTWIDALRDLFAVRVPRTPTHDQLQAIVSGIAGLTIESGSQDGLAIAGVPPVFESGHWREGFIVNPC